MEILGPKILMITRSNKIDEVNASANPTLPDIEMFSKTIINSKRNLDYDKEFISFLKL